LSPFRETILIDADALFIQNPEILFDHPGYIDSGALFFQDRIVGMTDKHPWFEKAMPEPISDKMKQNRMLIASRNLQESGVVVVDKPRHFISLLLVTWINGPGKRGPPNQGDVHGFYEEFYGR
jgi:hypothetical protein